MDSKSAKLKLKNKKHKANTARKKSLQRLMGSQVAREGQKWAKRAKKAFLDHIIDQKRLIKGFRLKIGKK